MRGISWNTRDQMLPIPPLRLVSEEEKMGKANRQHSGIVAAANTFNRLGTLWISCRTRTGLSRRQT